MPSLSEMPASLVCEILELVVAEDEDTALESAMERPALALELALLSRAFLEPGLQVAMANVRIMRVDAARALAVALAAYPARARWIRAIFVAVEVEASVDEVAVEVEASVDERAARVGLTQDLGAIIGSAVALRDLALAIPSVVLVGLAPIVAAASMQRPYPQLSKLVVGMADPLTATVQHALLVLVGAFRSTLRDLTVNAEHSSIAEVDLACPAPFPNLLSIKLMSHVPLGFVLAFANAAPALREVTNGHGHNFLTALDPTIAAELTTVVLLNMHRDEPALCAETFDAYGALAHLAIAGHPIGPEHLERLPKSLLSLAVAWSAWPDDLLAFVKDRSLSPNLVALRFHAGLESYEDAAAERWLDFVRQIGDACEERDIEVDLDVEEALGELVRSRSRIAPHSSSRARTTNDEGAADDGRAAADGGRRQRSSSRAQIGHAIASVRDHV